MGFYLKKYMWIISLAAVALCSYFLAKITANFIVLQFEGEAVPVSIQVPAAATQDEETEEKDTEVFEPVVARNVFDSRDVAQEPSEEIPAGEEVTPTGEAVATALKIKLVSTFAVGEGTDERSSCVISGGEGQGTLDVYTVNDKKQFAPDTRIVRVRVNRVEFVNKGRLEYVELEDFTKGVSINLPPKVEGPSVAAPDEGDKDIKIEQPSEGKFVIDRAEIDAALANLDKLYTDVRAVPHFKEGKPNGLKLLSVRPGSIFSKLGLRRGDVLQKINGVEMDIKRGLELFNQLKTESRITIDLERRDKTVTQEYEIR